MNLLALLEDRGAFQRGHTAFRNSLPANGWVGKGNLFRDPALLDEVAAVQSEHLRVAFPEMTLPVGAPACGAVLASLVAQRLHLPVACVLTGERLVMLAPSPSRTFAPDDCPCAEQE